MSKQREPWNWYSFHPLDVVQPREGRSFSAGIGANARAVFPRPSTASGALRNILGAIPTNHMGPLPASVKDDKLQLHFPTPLDLVLNEHRVERLEVQRWDANVMNDLYFAPSDRVCNFSYQMTGDGSTMGGEINKFYLQKYLEGENPIRREANVAKSFSAERRVGLARDGRKAREGHLYSAEFLRPAEPGSSEAVFASAVAMRGKRSNIDLTAAHGSVTRFGGEGKQVEVRHWNVDQSRGLLPTLPIDLIKASGRVLIYIATPAVFLRGWIPPLPNQLKVVAACVGAYEPVHIQVNHAGRTDQSTQAGEAKKYALHRAVPAGSVYFAEIRDFAIGNDVDAAFDWINANHGACLSQLGQLAHTGFGACLIGTWNPKGEE